MAGTYAKFLYFNYFEHDPALIPLAYNKGAGSIKKTKEFLQRHEGFDVSLDLVSEFRMAPADGIEYAYLVLAAQFIGNNPEYYGFTLSEPPEVDIKEIPDLYPDGFNKSLVGL